MTKPILQIENLSVTVGRKRILKDVSLVINSGEIHVLMGPNGGGKTTLLQAVMGMPGYKITEGRILFQGRDITKKAVDERARLGIALAFQKPPAVRGITIRALSERLLDDRKRGESLKTLASRTSMENLLDRELNVGLSGGEVKRSEMLQLLAMSPTLALFDEPESGVDLDNIAVVGGAIRSILKIGPNGTGNAGLIVTHTGHILSYVPADRAHVLMKGSVVCRGNPLVLIQDIKDHGYEECVKCRRCLDI